MTDDHSELFEGERFAALGAVIGILAFSNIMANEVIPQWLYVPWNIAIAAVLITIAMRMDGQRLATMGLAREQVIHGIRLAAPIAVLIAAGYLIAVAIPATRSLLMDERSDVPLIEMLYKILIEIPLGTVLLEEIAFRGILPAMLRARLQPGRRRGLRADAIAACMFGLWHILPSLSLGESNEGLAEVDPMVVQVMGVTLSVVATATVAMVLSWVRNRTDSVAGPALLHSTNNSAASLAAWLAQRAL